jgi:hypothetical protein
MHYGKTSLTEIRSEYQRNRGWLQKIVALQFPLDFLSIINDILLEDPDGHHSGIDLLHVAL